MNIKRTSSKINYGPQNYVGPNVEYQVETKAPARKQPEREKEIRKDEKKNNGHMFPLIAIVISFILGYGLSTLMNQPEILHVPMVPGPEIVVRDNDTEVVTKEDPHVGPEYRKKVSITENSVERDDDFLYTGGGTANTGEHKTYEIRTFDYTYGDPCHTTEPVIDSVGHKRHIHYDLAVWQDNDGDKAVEAWLVIKAGTNSDPDYMEVIKTTERMNCYSKPIEESVEIPSDAEYVYVEAHLNDGSGYLPLLTNDIYITVED